MRHTLVAFLIIFTCGLALCICGKNRWPRPVDSKMEGTISQQPADDRPNTVPFAADTSFRMQFFGDVMLDRQVVNAMGSERLGYVFTNVSTTNFIDKDAFVVANLEGPFAPKRITTNKTIAFRFDPSLATDLKAFGFDAFNMANNHSYDMGSANVLFTRQTLAAAGLGYFGDELNEGPAYSLLVTTSVKLGEPVAFLGVHNTYHEPDLAKVAAAMDAAKQQAKIIIVNVHWGEEYQRISNAKQRRFAHWFVDHGASAVIGHHPHVIEEGEVYKGAPIFYSLGNFIFDQYFSVDTQQGLSVELTADKGKIISAQLRPFVSKKTKVLPMNDAERTTFFSWFAKNSRFASSTFTGDMITL